MDEQKHCCQRRAKLERNDDRRCLREAVALGAHTRRDYSQTDAQVHTVTHTARRHRGPDKADRGASIHSLGQGNADVAGAVGEVAGADPADIAAHERSARGSAAAGAVADEKQWEVEQRMWLEDRALAERVAGAESPVAPAVAVADVAANRLGT